MSFLSDLIKDVRKELNNPNADINVAVTHFKIAITTKLAELYKADNLRIFDGAEGGVVRGPKKSRFKCENKITGNVFCQKEYLNVSKLEVPYFRAVFNSPCHKITLKENPESFVRLIGYESPLMRKKRDNINPEIGPRAISCDLVGLTSDNRVLCIEGKVNPLTDATNIVYGLLESFAYGVCVEYFLSEKKRLELFQNEVRACLKEFHPKAIDFDESKLTSSFTLAAPKEYFAEYFKPCQMTQNKANKRLSEVKKILGAFRGIKGPAWAGFLIMTPPCLVKSFDAMNNIMISGKKCFEPHFAPESMNVVLAEDIYALKKACEA